MIATIIMMITGLLTGILSAILGIGGGIIMLPATQFLLNFRPTTAVATTLLAVAFTSFSGALGYYRTGKIDTKNAMLVSGGGILGVLAGSYIFKEYLTKNTYYIELLLGILFLVMAYKMIKELLGDIVRKKPLEVKTKVSSKAGYVCLGIFTGLLTGMLGIGGGFIMVPAMIWLLGLGQIEAVGTTLLAMLPIAVFGAVIKLSQGFVNLQAGLIIGLGSIVGAQIGVRISQYINSYVFKGLFVIIFIYLAFSYLSPLVG